MHQSDRPPFAKMGSPVRDYSNGEDGMEDSDRENLVAEDQYGDDIDDIDPLLPDGDLLIERLKNELEPDLAGADAYERM
jgi:hypothetical protein